MRKLDMARDFLPRSNKIEWHITYKCDLTCAACSRASFLRKPHTPDMTLADAEEFCRQAREIGWTPRVIIIGGEPTVHPQFKEFCRLARDWSWLHKPDNFVQVYSNGYSERARRLCDEVRNEMAISICADEWKPTGSRTGGEPDQSEWHLGMFVSPADAGLDWQGTCYCHSHEICGVGMDAWGYAPCATGLSLAHLLGSDTFRTKRLADIFDPDKVRAMTHEMCRHCGYAVSKREGTDEDKQAFTAYMKTMPIRYGAPMSPTWQKAFEGRR